MTPEYIEAAVRLLHAKLKRIDVLDVKPYKLTLAIRHDANGHPDSVSIEGFEERRETRAERRSAR